ncbi:MAG: tetratricopeptide repeat protein [Prosthecobacter sp.]|jgi:outer membrane protein assembly factor BamD (BamD/ComL family)|nr:tetratricopeptide repeat protein [Prosthecobacter sp.]
MKTPFYLRLALSTAVFSAFCATATPSYAFLGLFGKKDKAVPAGNEREAQERQAAALLGQAREAQLQGRSGKAQGIYQQIIRQYPFTTAAAEASYANAIIIRQSKSLQESFDAFQTFLTQYRTSPRFDDAIQQQFEIAEIAKGGKKERSLILIPVKMGGDDVVAMYKKIIENAPFGKLAPLAQFSIGEVYQDMGEKAKSVAAYQAVVDNYPNTKQAGEAQFRIGSISSVAASRSEDKSNLTAARDALTTYMTVNPKGDRASEAELGLRQINAVEAGQSLQVGKFYMRMGKAKAAAIYFNEALKYGSPEASAEARTLLAELAATDPEAVSEAKKGQPDQDYTVSSARNLKNRDDYIGPLAPELARLGQKPSMRAGNDNFLPIPLTEPTLPTKPGAAPGEGTLLPPVPETERPALLPVPPVPATPAPAGELPVPPKPPAP